MSCLFSTYFFGFVNRRMLEFIAWTNACHYFQNKVLCFRFHLPHSAMGIVERGKVVIRIIFPFSVLQATTHNVDCGKRKLNTFLFNIAYPQATTRKCILWELEFSFSKRFLSVTHNPQCVLWNAGKIFLKTSKKRTFVMHICGKAINNCTS